MTRIVLCWFVLLLISCEREAQVVRLQGETMGTTYSIIAVSQTSQTNEKTLLEAIETRLYEVNAGMSNWDAQSEISRFNRQSSTQPIAISSALNAVMEAAYKVHDRSDGQFDVTLGPLIDLWGFGSSDKTRAIPDDQDVQAALARVGQRSVVQLIPGQNQLQKLRPDATIYLASLAKGYGVDQIAEVVENLGFTDYLIEIGGDLLAKGVNQFGEPWRIGIEQPITGQRKVERIITVSGMGMATSGDYRNYFDDKDQRYSHIIDAKTGRPVTHNTASVTVLARSAMLADAWATALLALGQERGMLISEKFNLAALFIVRDADAPGSFVTSSTTQFKITTSDK